MREVIEIAMILVFSAYTLFYLFIFSKTFNIESDYDKLSDKMFRNEYITTSRKQRRFILNVSKIDLVIGVLSLLIGTFTPIYGITVGFLYTGVICIVKVLLTGYFILIIDFKDEENELSFKEKLNYFKDAKDVEMIINALDNHYEEILQ